MALSLKRIDQKSWKVQSNKDDIDKVLYVDKLEPTETVLEGHWVFTGGAARPDDVASRIDALVKNHLNYVASREGGWIKLYLDPDDGRYWELSYPSSESHGGGPPRLETVSKNSVVDHYGDINKP